MQTIAFLLGPEVFPSGLTQPQERAIKGGLALMNRELVPQAEEQSAPS